MTALPSWVPITYPQRVRCGEHFDAVIAPRHIVGHARDGLSMPVIETGAEAGFLVWLVRPGAARGWRLWPVEVYGPGRHLMIPPVCGTDTRWGRWRTAPAGDCLADDSRLYRELAEELVFRGRRTGKPSWVTSRVCHECDAPDEGEHVLVGVHHGASGPGWAHFACRACQVGMRRIAPRTGAAR